MKEENTLKPNYYRSKCGRFDIYDLADMFNLEATTFNAWKYSLRAGKKDPNKEIEDRKKAISSLQRGLEIAEAKQNKCDGCMRAEGADENHVYTCNCNVK